ncbi:Pr6Pr family membrane protein [Compostimonas suwonensis]|uniref:FAR-17a/AIG1-like protein n=1 Tax=Compostimonas suwonensis TaxID=1048394 RepID=A0A2M9BWB3_9MICO|nr:Pr6Pr family membrane protein [Compostimonas suwonensis]PJJ62232.1 hypothetical protein CLV54_2029 [Compostimonas suwonensis]
MRYIFAVLRLTAAAAILIAVIAQWQASVQSPVYNFFNFFGYFTIQSNLIIMAVFVVAAVWAFRRPEQPPLLVTLRGASTTYMATTGVVYNTLLADAALAGSFNVQWSNDILHKWIPLYAVLDWVFFGDRSRIAWKRLWLFLIYPLVWVVVMLIRGATDGFVPYPFLSPTLGYGVVTLYCLGIAVFIAGMSAVVIALSRTRILVPTSRFDASRSS